MNQRSRPHLRTASTVPAILHNMAHILGNSLYKSLLKVVLIPLYQMSSFAHAAEIIESMSMTVQPVLCFHVVAGFCIDIVNSKGCRCVPARWRYFSGKMSLKVRAGAAVWAVYAEGAETFGFTIFGTGTSTKANSFRHLPARSAPIDNKCSV